VGIEYLLARWGDDDDLADLRDAVWKRICFGAIV
jgi:hypothetical protein